MEKLTTRYIILCFALLLVACFANLLAYSKFDRSGSGLAAVAKIPRNIGAWHGKDVKLDPLVYNILETRAIIHRSYLRKNRAVFLSIVYYPKTKVDFHAPEGCLAGQGVQIDKSARTIYINYRGEKLKINVNQLVRWRSGSNELIFYFYKAGRFMGKSYIRLRFNLALNKFGKDEKSGSLIRVSAPVSGDDYQRTSETLVSFITDLYPYLVSYL